MMILTTKQLCLISCLLTNSVFITQTNIMHQICADIGLCLRLCQCTMHNISVIWHAAVVMVRVRVRGQLAPTSHVTSLATSAWGLRSARLGPRLGASLFVFSQLEFLPCLNHAHVNTAQLSASSLEYHCFDKVWTRPRHNKADKSDMNGLNESVSCVSCVGNNTVVRPVTR